MKSDYERLAENLKLLLVFVGCAAVIYFLR